MLDLLIVNPAAAHGITGGHPIYGDLGNELIAVEPPLFCRLIAGYVRDRGYSVKIIDAEADRLNPESVARIALDEQPRLICIAVYGHQPSSSTQQMFGAGQCAREIKRLTEAPVIMVGGHPSALPERTLREEAIDWVGVGEGPLTVVALLKAQAIWRSAPDGAQVSNQSTIPGLVWRVPHTHENGFYRNKPAPLIEDLSELHGDAWDLLPMEKYKSHQWQCLDDLSKRQPYASIYTSLNCPYRCSFCCISAPFSGNRYQMRNPKQVVDEIEMLHQRYGISTLKITDEMFILNQRHYTAISEGIIERGLGDKLNLWAYSRVDTVKPSTLDLLRRAGFRWLALGIESGSKHVRDGADKAMRTEDIVGTVKTIQSHGINVIGNFMIGLADDTPETIKQTYDLAIECMPDWSNWYVTMAYPGSALYTQALKEGWKLPPDWKSFSQHNEDSFPLSNEHLTSAEILRFRDEAFNAFFTDPRYLSHIERKFGAAALAHVRDMTKYKLKRKLTEAA